MEGSRPLIGSNWPSDTFPFCGFLPTMSGSCCLTSSLHLLLLIGLNSSNGEIDLWIIKCYYACLKKVFSWTDFTVFVRWWIFSRLLFLFLTGLASGMSRACLHIKSVKLSSIVSIFSIIPSNFSFLSLDFGSVKKGCTFYKSAKLLSPIIFLLKWASSENIIFYAHNGLCWKSLIPLIFFYNCII